METSRGAVSRAPAFPPLPNGSDPFRRSPGGHNPLARATGDVAEGRAWRRRPQADVRSGGRIAAVFRDGKGNFAAEDSHRSVSRGESWSLFVSCRLVSGGRSGAETT